MAINNRDRNNTRQRTRTVFVPVGGGGSKIETEELSVSENGTYEAGEDKAYSKVTVKVTEPLGTVKIADYGIKFAYSSFREVPEWVDFEGVTDMSNMFKSSGIQTIPLLDTSKVTNMESMFNLCFSLQTIPLMDTSSVTNMATMFQWDDNLKSIPQIDTSKVSNIHNMFNSCSSLVSIGELNMSSVDFNTTGMFSGCYALTDLGGFPGLHCELNLSYSSNLTVESLMNVINKMDDVTANPQTLNLGSTNLAKLTEAQIAVATNKGWTLA